MSLSDIIFCVYTTGKALFRWCDVAKSGAERMRKLREQKKTAGNKGMLVILPEKYKQRFDVLRRQLNASISETVCYLIDNAEADEESD